MKTIIRNTLLAGLLGVSSFANAGLLSYQGVSFASNWSGNVLTLEIDAATHTGDWAKAKGLAALELDGIGDYTSVKVTAAPKGAAGWTTSSSELTAKGCSGATNGQDGSRLCFFGQQIALADDMVFSFAFSGAGIDAIDPHVKVEFVNAKGTKVGSLLSQTLPKSPVAAVQPVTQPVTQPATQPATTPVAQPVTQALTPPATQTASGTAANTAASTLPVATSVPASATVTPTVVQASSIELPPAASLPTTPLAAAFFQAESTMQTAEKQGDVPEPQSIALLLGGLGAMGLLRLRRTRA